METYKLTTEALKTALEAMNKQQAEWQKESLIKLLKLMSVSDIIVKKVEDEGMPLVIYVHTSIDPNIKGFFNSITKVFCSEMMKKEHIFLSWVDFKKETKWLDNSVFELSMNHINNNRETGFKVLNGRPYGSFTNRNDQA